MLVRIAKSSMSMSLGEDAFLYTVEQPVEQGHDDEGWMQNSSDIVTVTIWKKYLCLVYL